MNAEIHAHAAALVVALLKAGELEAAESFVEWALEHLEYYGDFSSLTDLVENYDA